MILKVINFKRSENDKYEKGFYLETNNINNKIIDKNGNILDMVYDFTSIEIGKLLSN